MFVAVYIRSRLHESPAFEAEQRKVAIAVKMLLAQVFSERGGSVVLGFLSVTGHNANASCSTPSRWAKSPARCTSAAAWR